MISKFNFVECFAFQDFNISRFEGAKVVDFREMAKVLLKKMQSFHFGRG